MASSPGPFIAFTRSVKTTNVVSVPLPPLRPPFLLHLNYTSKVLFWQKLFLFCLKLPSCGLGEVRRGSLRSPCSPLSLFYDAHNLSLLGVRVHLECP
jgi:hypothetical protein